MISKYYVTVGAGTSAGGTVVSGSSTDTIDGVPLVLLCPETHEPLRHRRYRLAHTDGTIEGTTDRNGATRPLTAAERASFVKWHADEPGA